MVILRRGFSFVALFALAACDGPADEIDIRATIEHWNPEFGQIAFDTIGTDDRGETVFSGTAVIGEDLYRPISMHDGGGLCGVAWNYFEAARADRPALKPATKTGGQVQFDGSVLFREADSASTGFATPNDLIAGVWEFRHSVEGVKGIYAGRPTSEIERFEDAVVEGTPEFDALCAEAKKLAGE